MDNFVYDPIEIFQNKASYPNPSSEDATREQFARPLKQIRDFVNNNLVPIGSAFPSDATSTNKLTSKIYVDTNSGKTLEASLDQSTYKLSISLKSIGGTTLSTITVDLPLEEMLVNVSYDSDEKELIFTLKSGTEVAVPIGDILTGIATQTYVTNAISSEDTAVKSWANGQIDAKETSIKSWTNTNFYTKSQVDDLIPDVVRLG